MSSLPSPEQQIVPADIENSDGLSSSVRRRLVAPSVDEILCHPVRVPDDLCLVEEGLCHPENPEVFLSASIQFLTQKLHLRLARLQGESPVPSTSCFFCFNQNHVALRSSPPCEETHDELNFKTVFSTSTVEQGHHVCRNTSLATHREYPRNVPETKSDRLTLEDYQNFRQNNLVLQGRPDWGDFHFSKKDPGHCIPNEKQLPISVPPSIPLNDIKQNPESNENNKPNVKMTKTSKHYTKVHSAVLHFIGSKQKKRTKYLHGGNCDRQPSDDSFKSDLQTKNKNRENCQTSSEIGLPREEECTSLKSVSLGELSENAQEDTSKRRHRRTSSNSPRSSSKISCIFSNLFNKNDKHLKSDSKRPTMEEIQDNSSKVQAEICNENIYCPSNISTPCPHVHPPDAIQCTNHCNTSGSYSRANQEDSKQDEEQCRYMIIPRQLMLDYSAPHNDDGSTVLHRTNAINESIDTCCYRGFPVKYSGIGFSQIHHHTIENTGNTQERVFHNSVYLPSNVPNQSSDINSYQTKNFGTSHSENDKHSMHKKEHVFQKNMHCSGIVPNMKHECMDGICVPHDECKSVLGAASLSMDFCGNRPQYESSDKRDLGSLRREMLIESQNNPRRSQPCNKQPPIACCSTRVAPMFPQCNYRRSDITTRKHSREAPQQQRHVTTMPPKEGNSVTYVTRTVSRVIETKKVVKNSEEERTEIWGKEASFTTLYVSHVNEEPKTPTHTDSALSRIMSHLAKFSNQSESDVLSLVISHSQVGTRQVTCESPMQRNKTTQTFEQSTKQSTSNQMSDKYFQKREISPTVNRRDVELSTVKQKLNVIDVQCNGEKEFNGKSESARLSAPLKQVVGTSEKDKFLSKIAGTQIQQNATPSPNSGNATNRIAGHSNVQQMFKDPFDSSNQRYGTTSSGIVAAELSTTPSSQCPSFVSHVSRQLSKLSVYESSTSRSTCSEDSLTDPDDYSGKVNQTNGQSISDECKSKRINTDVFAREAGMTPQMIQKLRGYPSAEK